MAEDKWSRWLLKDRFGGDEKAIAAGTRRLMQFRDRVLDNARLEKGETLLDIGAGDGLIAFGAAELLGGDGRVLFTDTSRPLLTYSRAQFQDAGAATRVDFLQVAAEATGLADAAADVVTTRSVLIYVRDKASAFREFFRLLRPGGRLSIFEPINSFRLYGAGEGRDHAGAPAGPTDKLRAYYNLRPAPEGDADPMLHFDEKDLLRLAEAAGFQQVNLHLEVRVGRSPPMRWDDYLQRSPNPNVGTVNQVLSEALTPEERREYEAYWRPVAERGGSRFESAVAFMWAVKPGRQR